MDKHHLLSHCRKRYLNLTKLYLSELERGVALESLTLLKRQMDNLLKQISDLEQQLGETGESPKDETDSRGAIDT